MRDIFAQLFAPNAQGETNAFGSNPNALSLAGLIAATGNKSLGDALPAAAQIVHKQQTQMMQKQKLEQQQQQLATAAQIIKNGGGLTDLLAAGINNPAILGNLPQPQWVPDAALPNGGRFITPPMSGGMPGNNMSMGMPNGSGAAFEGMQGMGDMGNIPQSYDQMEGNSPLERSLNIEDKFKKKTEADKVYKEAGLKISEAGKGLEDIKVFNAQLEALNKRRLLKEGALAPAADFVGSISKSVTGSDLGRNLPALESARSIRNKTLLPMIKIMGSSNSFSNQDRQFLENTLAQGTDSYEGQKRINMIAEVGFLREKAENEALRAYIKQNGTQDGFAELWAAYSASNDIFDIKPDGSLNKINKENISNWRPYILEGEMPTKQETATEAYMRRFGGQ